MNNLKRIKKLVLAKKETRRLYRMIQLLIVCMVISCTIVVVVAKWIEHDQNQKREEMFGSWDEVFLDVPVEDLNYFKQNAFLEQISVQSIQEKVFLEGDKRVVIGSCDDNFLEMGNIELIEGRMPEKEKEVVVEEEYLKILGVLKVGDTIPADSEVESLRGYKVVGKISNYSRIWKLINNINFLNCIVFQNKNSLYQIFVEYNSWSEKDPEINMINYERNASDFYVDIKCVFKIIVLILIMIAVVIFIIIQRIKNDLTKSENAFIYEKNRDRLTSITLILSFVLDIVLLLTIVNLTNMLNIQYDFALEQSKFEMTINVYNEDNKALSLLNFYWYDIQNGILNEVKYDLVFPLKQFVDKLLLLFEVLLMLILIVYLLICMTSNYKEINKNKFFNYDYFYYKRKKIEGNKIVTFIRMSYIFFISIIVCMVFLFKYNHVEMDYKIQFINTYITLTFVCFVLIDIIIKSYLKLDLIVYEDKYH